MSTKVKGTNDFLTITLLSMTCSGCGTVSVRNYNYEIAVFAKKVKMFAYQFTQSGVMKVDMMVAMLCNSIGHRQPLRLRGRRPGKAMGRMDRSNSAAQSLNEWATDWQGVDYNHSKAEKVPIPKRLIQ
ncbi:MAG: hypothetical protein AAF720_00365 [Pseudomonadota bacterium]